MRDFGAGLSVDELVGLSAGQIVVLRLPGDHSFHIAMQAARIMTLAGLASHLLVELWEDGHCVWIDPDNGLPVVVSPDGKLIPTQSRKTVSSSSTPS